MNISKPVIIGFSRKIVNVIMSNQLYVTFVRHGETTLNALKLLQGHTDAPLSPTGILQAELLGKNLKGLNFDSGFSSDLSRAHNTAKLILKNMNCEISIQQDNNLRERMYGNAEGKPIQEIRDGAAREGVSPYKYTPPGGETPESLNLRVATFFNSMCKLADEGKNEEILVVTHGGWIAALMRYLYSSEQFNLNNFDESRGLGIPSNTSRTRMNIHPKDADQRTLTFSHINEASHLEKK